jgi:hypothetical protein
MVYLALDRSSALGAIAFARAGGNSVWVGSDAISEQEHRRFVSEGVKLTRFIYPLAGAQPSVVEDALATIEEHHPGEIIWVQHVRKP